MVISSIRLLVLKQDTLKVELRDASGGFVEDFEYPLELSDEQVQALLQKGKALRGDNPAGSLVIRTAEALSAALLHQDLQQLILEERKKAMESEQSLSLLLEIDDQDLHEIAGLPWELMYLRRPGSGDCWLSTDPNLVWSRRRPRRSRPEPILQGADEPLRVMLVISAPKGQGPVRFTKVLSTLQDLAKQHVGVELTVLGDPAGEDTPTRIGLRSALEKVRPQVLHFIGHGQMGGAPTEEATPGGPGDLLGQGEIALLDSLNNADWVPARELGEIFAEHPPRVAMLQACELAATPRWDAFSSVASSLLEQHVPVVVAMQYRISNISAGRFSERFYSALLMTGRVDRAVQAGRQEMAGHRSGHDTRDYSAPVLFMQVDSGRLLPLGWMRPDLKDDPTEEPKDSPVAELLESFNSIRNKMKAIEHIKSLHVGFRTLDSHLRYIESAARGLPGDERAWESITEHSFSLDREASQILALEADDVVVSSDFGWKSPLILACQELQKAVDKLDRMKLNMSCDKLRRVVKNQSPVMDNTLIKSAKDPQLIDYIQRVKRTFNGQRPAWVPTPTADDVQQHANDMAQRIENLNNLIFQHKAWQQFDEDLRMVERMLTQYTASERKQLVEYITPCVKNLQEHINEAELEVLMAESERLAQALAGENNGYTMAFRKLYSTATRKFIKLDMDQLMQCKKLISAGNQLEDILRSVNHAP